MAVSGTISTTTFNTNKVIDHSFRRCRLPAQAITAEMQSYAKDALYLLLSELASIKAPSWCVERQVYPFYQGQSEVTLDLGTVEVLNANLRVTSQSTGTVTDTGTTYHVAFTGSTTVVTVGVKWSAASVSLTFQVSADNATWTTVGTQSTSATAGQWTWTDITLPNAYAYFRITAASTISYSEVYLGSAPQEIPMGVLNRDQYVAQSNKTMQDRPLTYWYKRDRSQPKMMIWPAANLAAEHMQLIVWRHRHIMDVGTLAQEIEVPQRWMEAIVAGLAARVAAETPAVDAGLMPMLDQKAATAFSAALTGDNSGASSFFQPSIGVYTA